MDNFWGGVAFVAVLSLVLLAAGQPAHKINFTDLETECREDRTEEVQVRVEDNSILYSGHFPVQNTEADMRYNFDRSGDRITLNVRAINDEEPSDFREDCYATGVYKASTVEYDGRYTLVTRHNGEQVDKRIVDFQ